MRRPSYIQRQVLTLIRAQEQRSYEELAATINCDRSSVVIAVRQLEMRHMIVKIQGAGRQANRYLITDIEW